MREAERRSLFHSIHDRANFSASLEHLCQDALLLLALLDIHQSKPMRVNIKEPVELEPMRKIGEIRIFSNKELKLIKESMGALPRTSLMVIWELMRPSWCPSPKADSILLATQDVKREINSDCNLRDLNIIYNVMTTASKSNGEDKVELPGWGPEDWFKPGSCLAEVCGLEGHVCGSLDCVKTLEKQHQQLTT